ncbi:fumarylacetoacetate hydrolase family protein [Bacillus sp. EB01]|uniref:fumarylacetoacetate hydrolase family protein n=1 Tax=Bacillus sp. EB01 TaxID=1347086 RepID=UPI0005C73A05|nr:fumarylacetoacetate hydrolase family protein [Bacillus sp. EB01]
MKLGTMIHKEETLAVLVSADGQAVLPLKEASSIGVEFPVTLLGCLEEGNSFYEKAKSFAQWAESAEEAKALWIPISDVELLAPIPRPAKNVMCIGKNYAEHAIEMGSADDIPEHVMVFTKPPTAVIGPDKAIPSHSEITDQLDYEGELAVIIGKKGTGITKEEAKDYVFGYTILNDVTARDLQKRHKQYFLGKGLDGSAPMGPWIVTKDEIPHHGNLGIQTKVNGEIRQDSNTKHLIFPIEQLIEDLSKGMTLEPGDIIATGTPAGVGKGFKPPKFLKSGDTIEIMIEGIGVLKNTVS